MILQTLETMIKQKFPNVKTNVDPSNNTTNCHYLDIFYRKLGIVVEYDPKHLGFVMSWNETKPDEKYKDIKVLRDRIYSLLEHKAL